MNRVKEQLESSYETSSLSVRSYNLAIGLTLAYGCILSAILASSTKDFVTGINPWLFVIIYFVVEFGAQALACISSNPFITFIAYNLCVLPIGMLLSTFVSYYTKADITVALISVAAVTVVMCCASTMFPKFFESLGLGLFLALLIGIFVELVVVYAFGYKGTLFDWFFVVLFSLYVGFDWVMAESYPRTVNNAILSSISLYLDIVNLFVRLLSILGNKNDE